MDIGHLIIPIIGLVVYFLKSNDAKIDAESKKRSADREKARRNEILKKFDIKIDS